MITVRDAYTIIKGYNILLCHYTKNIFIIILTRYIKMDKISYTPFDMEGFEREYENKLLILLHFKIIDGHNL